MTLGAPRAAIIGVRADKHPVARIIQDHLIQIAVLRPAQIAGMIGLGGLKRVVFKIQADDACVGRHRIDALFTPSAKQLDRGHFQFWVIKFGDWRGIHHIAVLYLDRKIVAHDLLQAIARVNRTNGTKRCGYVVDYIGVARHLNEALKDYDGQDIQGSLIDITVELPKLLDRRARAVAIFTDRGIADLQKQVTDCVDLLADLKTRADFINKVRMFYETLNTLEHRPEVPGDVFRDAKLLGFINKVAANLYRDPALDLLGVAEKVKALINGYVSARGVDPKIPPTAITDAEFEKALLAQSTSRARAAQMQHAARYHIVGFSNQNPAYARKMSEKLEEILQRFKDDWDALERELRKLINELKQGDRNDFPDLDPKAQVPFVRLVLEECGKGRELKEDQRAQAITTTLEMVERIRQEVAAVGFWKNPHAREMLTRRLVRDLDQSGICNRGTERALAQQIVALAKENHENLVRP